MANLKSERSCRQSLFFVLLLLTFAMPYIAKAQEPVTLSVIKQTKINSQSQGPLATREILFRITNNTKNKIYLPGFNWDDEFHIGSLLIQYNEEKGWVTRGGKDKPPAFEAFRELFGEYHALKSGKYYEFTEQEDSYYVGKTLKCYLFISKSKNGEPEKIESPEFVLE